MGVRELVGDANGVPASEKVKKHCSRLLASVSEYLSKKIQLSIKHEKLH